MLNRFVAWLENNNWNIITNSDTMDLPDTIQKRYQIPKQWYDFISNLQMCENSSSTKWFLTAKDYLPQEQGFQWNEFEMQSLEYCDDENDIISYWDKHLPIFLSVDGEYSYYAINIENGNVVAGYEPEYEDSTVIAEDFNSFIEKIITNQIAL